MDPAPPNTGQGSIRIRAAIADDCDAISRLTHELADFEGYPGPDITGENLRHDGFPASNSVENTLENSQEPAPRKSAAVALFSAIVAEDLPSSKVVGYALCTPFFSIFSGRGTVLENLYVRPECRKLGVGQRLFAAVCRSALDAGGNAVRLDVLGRNVVAKRFYERQGMESLTWREDGAARETGTFRVDALRRIARDQGVDDCAADLNFYWINFRCQWVFSPVLLGVHASTWLFINWTNDGTNKIETKPLKILKKILKILKTFFFFFLN